MLNHTIPALLMMLFVCLAMVYGTVYLTIYALGVMADLWHVTRVKLIRAYQAQRLARELREEGDR